MANESDLRTRIDGRTVEYNGQSYMLALERLVVPKIPKRGTSADVHLRATGGGSTRSFMVHVSKDTLEDFDALWDNIRAGVANRVDGQDGDGEYL